MSLETIGLGIKILEEKSAKELGKSNTDRYCRIKCPECGEERWAGKSDIKKYKSNGICRSCHFNNQIGDKNFNWKGGRVLFKSHARDSNYILIRGSGHPKEQKNGYIFEHILIWEQVHNKRLPEGWIIHHLNGVGTDNRPENLVALPRQKHDSILSAKAQRIRILEAQVKLLEQALTNSQMIFNIGEN